MPDFRVQLMRDARLRLGEAPRSIDRTDLDVCPRKPALSFGMRTGQKKAYEGFATLLEQGRVVWGALICARADLFGAGGNNGRGVVAYTPDLHVFDNLDPLVVVSEKLTQLRESGKLSDIELTLSEDVDSSNAWFSPRTLPEAITPNRRVFLSSILVVRRHLPLHRLVTGYFPILVDTRVDSVAILPQRYWPQEMKDHWAQSA